MKRHGWSTAQTRTPISRFGVLIGVSSVASLGRIKERTSNWQLANGFFANFSGRGKELRRINFLISCDLRRGCPDFATQPHGWKRCGRRQNWPEWRDDRAY